MWRISVHLYRSTTLGFLNFISRLFARVKEDDTRATESHNDRGAERERRLMTAGSLNLIWFRVCFKAGGLSIAGTHISVE